MLINIQRFCILFNVNILFFIVFYFYFYFLGRGLIIILNSFKKKVIFDDSTKIFDTSILIFYPIIGMIAFSNILFILNFFFPLKNLFIIGFITLIVFFNFTSQPKFKQNAWVYIFTIINCSILSISTYDINFQYDAGYYHLNYQNWIREFKLIFGLNNLHGAFGNSSIVDYIAAPLWIGDNLILLHYVSILFIVFLINFLAYHIIFSKNTYLYFSSIFLSIYGLMDNFGVGGGRNGFFTIHGIIKPDIPSGIIFYVSCVLLTHTLIKKSITQKEMIFLNFILIFSYQLKISSALLLGFFLYVIISLKKFRLSSLITTNLVLIIWSIKNILLTSCLVYPINFTCLNSAWYSEQSTQDLKMFTRSHNNSYIIGDSFGLWFNNWISVDLNKITMTNFLFSILLIYLIKLLLVNKKNNSSYKIYLIPLFFILSNIFIWITGAAHPRFIYGLFGYIVTVPFINSQNLKIKSSFRFNNFMFVMLLLFTTLLIPRLNSYKAFYQDPFKMTTIEVPVVKYKNINEDWVIPSVGDQCWINIDCIPYVKNIFEQRYFTYKSFNSRG